MCFFYPLSGIIVFAIAKFDLEIYGNVGVVSIQARVKCDIFVFCLAIQIDFCSSKQVIS